ncbi:serine hydrolase domain-containing protein [Herbiconiux liangxiaofengii]|uniref:serine hydrolase domain-containing protein n=1 Tax=Herbiconiux liangxiaofengii TaxID=3342795 RepID=UPI0035BB7FC7
MTAESVLQAGARHLVSTGIPGVVLGLHTPAGDVFGCAGTRIPSTSLPPTPETAFDIASVTKVLATTTSLLRLVSAGSVSLDDRVERFVPPFSGGAKSDVTLRHLLTHRGGLQPWWPLYPDAASPSSDRPGGLAHPSADALELAAALPLAAAPGTTRLYSDLGFMLLGRVIESVTGERLADAAAHLVFAPLGLTSTGYAHPVDAERGGTAASSRGDEIERRMVRTGIPYPVPFQETDFGFWRDELLVGEVNDGNAFHAFGGVSGHAGLFSTPRDLLAFATALSDYRDHDELWNPAVTEQFFAASADPEQAIGFRRSEWDLGEGPVTVLGHPGFTGVAVGFVPGASVAVVIATNRLLAPGEPVPNADLWERATRVWGDARSEAVAPRARRAEADAHPAPPHPTPDQPADESPAAAG